MIVALILGSVRTALYCTVGAGRCCGQGRVTTSELLVDAGELRLELTRLMQLEASMHIQGFLTGAFHISHRRRLHFGVLALHRFPLFFQAGPTLLFCETLAQLLFSALFFNPLF